jgi:hypothetical protein
MDSYTRRYIAHRLNTWADQTCVQIVWHTVITHAILSGDYDEGGAHFLFYKHGLHTCNYIPVVRSLGGLISAE